MKRELIYILSVTVSGACIGFAAAEAPATSAATAGATASMVSSAQPGNTLGESLGNEAHAAIDRGLDWLAANQNKDGSWSNPDFPALTALALQAFTRSEHPKKKTVIDPAVKFILSCARENGSICKEIQGRKGGGLSNYNTAICMTALQSVGDPSLAPVILKARTFIANSQHFGDDTYDGGFGYDKDTGRAYTDLLNTHYSMQAMRATQGAEDLRPAGEKKADINWDKALQYTERMQNKPEAGEADAGGFFYNPSDPKAGAWTNKEGVVVFRSFGSITYVGLLNLIYAQVDRNDPRVLSAIDWSSKHWSLEENPGMGPQGVYFFYNILSKALTAAGRDTLKTPDGNLLNWREPFTHKLVSLQKVDPANGHGYWENVNNRFWENDRVLVTAYSVMALEMLLN